jgi:hypothetical protein
VIVVFLVTGITLSFLYLLKLSLDPNSILGKAFQSYLPLILAGIPGLITALIAMVRKGIPVPVPLLNRRTWCVDSRRVLRKCELRSRFKITDGVSELVEDGWLFRGDGRFSATEAKYEKVLSTPFSIAAEVMPVRKESAERYWRIGFVVEAGGKQSLTFHLDSHNLIACSAPSGEVFQLSTVTELEGKWSLIELQVGIPNGTELVIYGCLAGR